MRSNLLNVIECLEAIYICGLGVYQLFFATSVVYTSYLPYRDSYSNAYVAFYVALGGISVVICRLHQRGYNHSRVLSSCVLAAFFIASFLSWYGGDPLPSTPLQNSSQALISLFLVIAHVVIMSLL